MSSCLCPQDLGENKMKEPLVLDNTKRSTYRLCKAKYYLQHLHGLQSNYGSTALRYGSTWHGVQEGFNKWVKENGWYKTQEEYIAALSAGLEHGNKVWEEESESKLFHTDFKNFNTAADAFNQYLTYFAEDKNHLEIIDTEKKFSCPIEPESEAEARMLAKLPPVIFTGKIDLCVKMDGMNWIQDFKTTGWYLDKVIQQANRSPQLIGYSYASKEVLDFEVAGCLCSFHFLASTKSKVTGEYGKVRFDFRRVPQIYTENDISAWKLAFLDTCIDIQRSMEENLWPQSFDNCYQYGACPYLKLCQQHVEFEELNLEGFHEAFWDVLEEE